MSGGEAMTRERFELLAEAYGGAIELWPVESQAAARALVESDAAAAAALREAAALDALLDPLIAEDQAVDAAPAPSDALTARMLADAATITAERQEAPVAAAAGAGTLDRAAAITRRLGERALTLVFGEATPLAAGVVGGAVAMSAVAGLSVGLMSATPEPTRAPALEYAAVESGGLLDYALGEGDSIELALGGSAGRGGDDAVGFDDVEL